MGLLRALTCLLLGSASIVGSVSAQEPVLVELVVRAPSGADCPTASSIAQGVERRLGRRVFVEPDEAHVRLVIGIEAGEGGAFRATLSLEDEGEVLGTRELSQEGERCSALRESLPFVLALLVDVPLERAREMLAPATTPEQDSTPEPTDPVDEPTSLPVEVDGAPWTTHVTLGAGGDVDRVPGLSLGPSLALGLRAPFGVILSLSVSLGLDLAGPSGPGASFTSYSASLGICPQVALGRARLGGCIGILGGATIARPIALDYGTDQLGPQLEGRVWGMLDAVLFGPMFGRLEAGLGLPVVRHRFVFSQADGSTSLIHEIPVLVPFFGASLGIELS